MEIHESNDNQPYYQKPAYRLIVRELSAGRTPQHPGAYGDSHQPQQLGNNQVRMGNKKRKTSKRTVKDSTPTASPPSSSSSRSHEQSIRFYPPCRCWQKRKCEELELTVRGFHVLNGSSTQSFPPDTYPELCQPVRGDGNCLFRSLSFWITGEEEDHLLIRKAVIAEMKENPRVYELLTSSHDTRKYLDDSRMMNEGVWGSDTEIFVAANLLNTPIAVYGPYGEQFLWQVFKPMHNGSSQERYMIYLRNDGTHFEPVIKLQDNTSE